MDRDSKTAFIRLLQDQGVIFVCPQKDRALLDNEGACENCDCISDKPPQSGQPKVDVREFVERLDAKDKEIAEWKGVFENFRSLNAELRLRNSDLQGHANVLAARIAEMEAAPVPNIESAADRLKGLSVCISADGVHNFSGTLNKQSRIAVARALAGAKPRSKPPGPDWLVKKARATINDPSLFNRMFLSLCGGHASLAANQSELILESARAVLNESEGG